MIACLFWKPVSKFGWTGITSGSSSREDDEDRAGRRQVVCQKNEGHGSRCGPGEGKKLKSRVGARSLDKRRIRETNGIVGFLLIGLVCPLAAIKCFEGEVTYCGINADTALNRGWPGKHYSDEPNWACKDRLSNLDPTNIAPRCFDEDSCQNLQTNDIDDPFVMAHASPYNYVTDIEYISAARSKDGKATEKCSIDDPACGLQTTLRESTSTTCENCYTRFRYTLDLGAIYFNVVQIQKKCIEPGQQCLNNSACWCTTTHQQDESLRHQKYYIGALMDDNKQPIDGTENDDFCSPWAKAACRRKAYKCLFPPADYISTTYIDYDIKFCTIGSDDPACSGCVACTHKQCQQPVIHYSKLNLAGNNPFEGPQINLLDPATYNCSLEKCGEAPRTCWNKTCGYSDDCWPACDPTVYESLEPGAKMGFYVEDGTQKLIEKRKCCDTDFCNFPNAARRTSLPARFALLSLALLPFLAG